MYKPTSKALIKKAQQLNLSLDEEKVLATLNKTPKVAKYSNWELTRMISNKNLILHYGSQKAIPPTLLHRNQLQSAMLCARYTEQKPDFQEFVLQDNNGYIAEEKYNGCFCYDTPILLATGQTLPIGEIVENKLPVTVMSYNIKTKQLEPKRVVNWFNNGTKTEWTIPEEQHSQKNLFTSITKPFITPSHKIWDAHRDIYSAIQESHSCLKITTGLNDSQKAIIYGSILSRNPIIKAKTGRCNFHLYTYKDKLEWHALKHETLKQYLAKSRITNSVATARSKSLPVMETLYTFQGEVSNIPPLPEILTAWYLDTCYISPTSKDTLFLQSVQDFNHISEWLSYFEIVPQCALGKWIAFDEENSRKVYNIVSRYIPSELQYMLPEDYRVECPIRWLTTEQGFDTYPVPLYNYPKVRHIEQTAYDIEVEDNHNYFANNMLVHNCRGLLYYTQKEGFKLYSNNRDTQTLIPEDNTQNLIWEPQSYIGKLPFSFILDCEVVCPTKSIDTTYRGGTITSSELNSAITLLQLPPEESHYIQKTQHNASLQFKVFDLPFYKTSLINRPYKERRYYLEKLIPALKDKFDLPFELSAIHYENKQYYFESLVDGMKEGIVLKNLNGIYTFDETRSRDRQIKMKRSLKMQLGEDIDGFIIGHTESSKDKKYANYIGGFKIGVILKTFQGDVIHHVASITTLPDSLRQQATVIKDGKPSLNPEFLNRVLSFDGFDVKQSSLRFSHARVEDWNTCWRPDKSYLQCIMLEDTLREQAL